MPCACEFYTHPHGSTPMRKRSTLILHTLEALIVLVAVYFEPGHCLRGALQGEAFFKGRSTSYWRSAIDHWLTRYQTHDDALAAVTPYEPWMGSDIRPICINSPTITDRVRRFFTKEAELDYLEHPEVLSGFPDAEPVLQELD